VLAYVGKRLQVSLEESVLTVFGPDCNFLLEVSLFAVPYVHFRAIFKELYLFFVFLLYALCLACQDPRKVEAMRPKLAARSLPDLFRVTGRDAALVALKNDGCSRPRPCCREL
jgi:hypothetical protein